MIKYAARLKALQTSIYSRLDALKEELQQTGKKLINLSIGSPDLPPSREVKEVLSSQALEDRAYAYTLTRGTAGFRQACADWYRYRFGVELDPETEVLPLMGSQDGLTHIFWALIDHGDAALIPDPCYPIYSDGLALAGGRKIPLPLRAENNFLPDLAAVDAKLAAGAKLMILNYPNNPTAAVAPLEFFEQAAEFADKHDIVVCHDAAYTELTFDGFCPPSFLQAGRAREVGVEFHSLSKSFNLAGIRLGFAVGNPEIIKALEMIKSNIDYGTFLPILKAGTAVLHGSGQDTVRKNRQTYRKRRDIWVDGCAAAGWKMARPKGTMFVWAPVPTAQDSLSFVVDLAREAGVLLVPGVAYGRFGEGYVRIGLVQSEADLQEAVDRIGIFLQNKEITFR